jgi:cytochrome oxidase Cu insertion factor (SCO1/SenC/PrrC family)
MKTELADECLRAAGIPARATDAAISGAATAGYRPMWRMASLGAFLALCWPPLCKAAETAIDVLNAPSADWHDDHGMATRLSAWRGKTVLMTMAYSTCREVCSYSLHRLEELQRSADRAGTPIEVVVISYDPNIDGPASWSIYRRHHHLDRPNWHFLTGSALSTEQFVSAMHFPSWRYDEHLVHDFKILVIGPGGQVARNLTWATRNDDPFTAAATCPSASIQGCNQ